jgi:hypothetical protein
VRAAAHWLGQPGDDQPGCSGVAEDFEWVAAGGEETPLAAGAVHAAQLEPAAVLAGDDLAEYGLDDGFAAAQHPVAVCGEFAAVRTGQQPERVGVSRGGSATSGACAALVGRAVVVTGPG